jgi:hypothetical protein
LLYHLVNIGGLDELDADISKPHLVLQHIEHLSRKSDPFFVEHQVWLDHGLLERVVEIDHVKEGGANE